MSAARDVLCAIAEVAPWCALNGLLRVCKGVVVNVNRFCQSVEIPTNSMRTRLTASKLPNGVRHGPTTYIADIYISGWSITVEYYFGNPVRWRQVGSVAGYARRLYGRFDTSEMLMFSDGRRKLVGQDASECTTEQYYARKPGFIAGRFVPLCIQELKRPDWFPMP